MNSLHVQILDDIIDDARRAGFANVTPFLVLATMQDLAGTLAAGVADGNVRGTMYDIAAVCIMGIEDSYGEDE